MTPESSENKLQGLGPMVAMNQPKRWKRSNSPSRIVKLFSKYFKDIVWKEKLERLNNCFEDNHIVTSLTDFQQTPSKLRVCVTGQSAGQSVGINTGNAHVDWLVLCNPSHEVAASVK